MAPKKRMEVQTRPTKIARRRRSTRNMFDPSKPTPWYRFLQSPPEIRAMIYKHVFTPEKTRKLMYNYHFKKNGDLRTERTNAFAFLNVLPDDTEAWKEEKRVAEEIAWSSITLSIRPGRIDISKDARAWLDEYLTNILAKNPALSYVQHLRLVSLMELNSFLRPDQPIGLHSYQARDETTTIPTTTTAWRQALSRITTIYLGDEVTYGEEEDEVFDMVTLYLRTSPRQGGEALDTDTAEVAGRLRQQFPRLQNLVLSRWADIVNIGFMDSGRLTVTDIKDRESSETLLVSDIEEAVGTDKEASMAPWTTDSETDSEYEEESADNKSRARGKGRKQNRSHVQHSSDMDTKSEYGEEKTSTKSKKSRRKQDRSDAQR